MYCGATQHFISALHLTILVLVIIFIVIVGNTIIINTTSQLAIILPMLHLCTNVFCVLQSFFRGL